MLHLYESQNNRLQFLLGKRDYAQQYALLKRVLGPDIDFFARPEKYTDTTRWFLDNDQLLAKRKVLHFSGLSDDDKDTIADYIEDKKASIAAVLAEHPEFAKDYEQLFLVPDEQSIQIIQTEVGLQAILTEWACQSAETTSTIDPVGYTIRRPRKTTAQVLIEVFYTDGTLAVDKAFFIDYLGRSTREQTNSEGTYNRGRCKIDSTFAVYEQNNQEGKPLHAQEFTVGPGQAYRVYFPFITSGQLKVVDQDNQPMNEVVLHCTINEVTFKETSDDQGLVELNALEAGKNLVVKAEGYSGAQQSYPIQKQGNDFLLKLQRPIKVDKTVKVVNQHGEAQAGYPIILAQHHQVLPGEEKPYTTNEAGRVTLEDLEVGQVVQIIDQKNPANLITPLVTEIAEEYLLKITIPEQKQVTVLLLGYKKEPLPNISIDFTYKGLNDDNKPNTLTTSDGPQPEDRGKCILPYEDFEDQEKVKATIHLPITRRKKQGKKDKNAPLPPKNIGKHIKKKFTFDAEQQAYTLRLRRRPWWLLWFLLLLLPLLPIPVSLEFQALDAYQKKAILKPKKPIISLYSSKDSLDKTANQQGKADFGSRIFLLYQLFTQKLKAKAVCPCFETQTVAGGPLDIKRQFYLSLRSQKTTFTVVSEDDGEPLPDAKVEVWMDYQNYFKKHLTLTSNVAGEITIAQLPECANIKIIARKFGYQNDTIRGSGKALKTKIINLEPLTEKITFIVKNTEDKQPIPNALVSLYDQKNQRIQQQRTNINGKVGLVNFKVKVIDEAKKLKVVGEKKGLYPDSLSNIIADFIEAKEKYRTLWLKPKTKAISFVVIDQATKQPLPGAQVKIACGNHSWTEITNTNGVVTFPEIPIECDVKLIAQKENYKDNGVNGSLNDLLKDKNRRTIPLEPIIQTQQFVFQMRDCPSPGGQDDYFNLYVNGKLAGPIENIPFGKVEKRIQLVKGQVNIVEIRKTRDFTQKHKGSCFFIRVMPFKARHFYCQDNNKFSLRVNVPK